MSHSTPPNGSNGSGNSRSGSRSKGQSALPDLARKHGVDPFTLFCAYYLGITEDDRYEFQNIHQVAKRFGTSPGVVRQLLQDFGMDTDSIVHSLFDLAGAQIDVMRVPDGVSRTEVARMHYEQFVTTPRNRRDWTRELEQDARENEKTFGKAGSTRGRKN